MVEAYSFGYWVMRRRKALDLTRAALAQRVSCSLETIKKIERDERRPSHQVAELLAVALAVPDDERELFLQAARGDRPVNGLPLGEQPLASPLTPHNLPSQTTPFVGREDELEMLAGYLIDPATRLITILGPGGMGKTRLALAAAEAQLHDPGRPFPQGVFFVSLAPLGEPEQLLPAVAEALDLRFDRSGDPKEQLLDYLHRKRLLLLLDNFEHLKAGAGLVDEILAAASGVTALVTSRERLNRQAEQLFIIGGLALPDGEADGDLAVYGAIRLFVQSARRVRPAFELTPVNRPQVVELCRLVGGAPLSIVLAASWMGALSPEAICAEIRRDLDFLAVEMADVPERQRSLRAAFNHSWRLLTKAEQTIFRRLSVFRGGFDRAAAGAVAGASPRDLQSLVNKSLLVRAGNRYDVHELLRQYAAEKLAEAPEQEAVTRDRHSAHYCAFVGDLTANWHTARQLAALAAATREADNVWPALRRALEQRAWPRLRGAIDSWCTYLRWLGRSTEGASFCRAIAAAAEAWDDGATASPECLRLWAMALIWMSWLTTDVGEPFLADSTLRQSLRLLERPELAGQDVRLEKAFAYLVWYRYQDDVYKERQPYAEQSLALYQELNEPWAIAENLENLAFIDWWINGRLTRGLEKQQRAYAIQRKNGDRQAQIHNLHKMALLLKHLGHLDKAEEMQREVIRLGEELGERNHLPIRYYNLAYTLCWQGRYDEAVRLAEKGLAVAQEMGENHDFMIQTVIAYNRLHAGEYHEAHHHLESALLTADELVHPSSKLMWYTVSGELALAESAYTEARPHLLRSIELAQETGKHVLGVSLSDMALLEYHLKQLPAALANLMEALGWAQANENYMSAAFNLPAAALLLAASGRGERALELWALAQHVPIIANSKYYERLVGHEMAAVAATMPPAVAEAAWARGQALDFWPTVSDLLVFLEQAEQPGSALTGLTTSIPQTDPLSPLTSVDDDPGRPSAVPRPNGRPRS